MKDEDPKSSREFDLQIVEFEEWRRVNSSTDLQAFAKGRHLAPAVIEELKRCLEMEENLSQLIEGNDFASDQQESRDLCDQKIENYQLQEKLGVGGMGTVWLAHQSHPMNRKVAIKLIRPDRNSALTGKRFEREKQALALMSHAHVAQVYDAGITKDDRPYIAMEYVNGEPLTDYCQKRQLPLAARLELFLQLCSAIQHAHQNGLLHRDIKPSNILVTEVNGIPIVKVIDFGLVRPSDTWDSKLTETDMIVGTPLWMSPEQAGGFRDVSKNETVKTLDTRADVYSLGVILYQLLTDSTPIPEEYYERATKFELLQAIQRDIPELPSIRAGKSGFTEGKNSTPVSSWASVLRNELDWVTMRAIEKECDRRYSTVAAFADDVKNYLNNEPVAARPPSFSYRLSKLAQRHKTVAIATSIILSLLVLSSIALAAATYRSNMSAKAARAAEVKAKASEAVAQNAVNQMVKIMQLLSRDMEENYDPSANGAKYKESRVKNLDEFRAVLDEADFSDSPLLETAFRQILAESYSGSAEYDSAVSQYEKIIDILRREPDGNSRQLITAKLDLAREHALHLADARALPLAKTCLEESRERFGENDELTISARIMVNWASMTIGNIDWITADLKETVTLARGVLGDSHEVTADAIAALGQAHLSNYHHVEAAEQFEEALKLTKELYGENDLRTMDLKIRKLRTRTGARNTQGMLNEQGRFEDAALNAVIDESKIKFGDEHLFSLRLRQQKADAATTSRDFETAESLLLELIKVGTKNFGKMHASTMHSRHLIGRMYYLNSKYGNPSFKNECLNKGYKIQSELIEDYATLGLSESSMSLRAWAELASAGMHMNSKEKMEEALDISKRYLPKAEAQFGLNSKVALILIDVQRECLIKMGHKKESLDFLIEAYDRSLSLAHPSFATAMLAYSIAIANRDLGHRNEAVKYFEIVDPIFTELLGETGDMTISNLMELCNEQACISDYESAEKTTRTVIERLLIERFEKQKWYDMSQATEVLLGESLCEQEKFQEAKAILEKAAVPSGKPGFTEFYELHARSALALCYEAEGKRSEALAAIKSANAGMKKLEQHVPPEYVWCIKRCDDRLAKMETDGEEDNLGD